MSEGFRLLGDNCSVHAGFRETLPFRAFTDQVIVRPGLVGVVIVNGHPTEMALAIDLVGCGAGVDELFVPLP